MSRNVTRLFEQFHPENYQLSIKLDKEKLSFQGEVTISGLKVGRPSQRLTFHQKGLTFSKASLVKIAKDGIKEIELSRINKHEKLNEIRLHTEELLYPGQYKVRLEFNGKISDALHGLYPSRFKDDDGQDIILGTQFESHHAREVFPCIDEPEAKATFDLSLETGNADTVLANTPIKSEQVNGKTKTTVFEQTPIMSSYLLAFVVGKLAFREAQTKTGVKVRAYAIPSKVKQTEFGLDLAVKYLEFYNDYFGIDYPLEKLDMVALPDFANGAMENWGLVTYREQCLLVDPANTSLPNKQYVAVVVAHELAHQWFGNLVTMRWWTDLWLNEGFASWIEYLAVDHVFPDWQMWVQYNAEDQQAALRLDALDNTHPIEVPVHHPDEIRVIFDTISYSKGSCVINMLHKYLGPDTFRDGLRLYLKQHAYKNTDTVDLWRALSEVSGKDVESFMHNWTAEPGFPLLSVENTKVRQQRFYLNRPKKPADTIWEVPLLSKPEQDIRLLNKESTSIRPVTQLNIGRSGYYRIVYDKETNNELAAQIKSGDLSPTDRLGILSDIFEAAKAGYGDTVSALQLLENFQDEDNAAVWDVITLALSDIRKVFGDDQEIRDAMKIYVKKLIAKQLSRLGWEPTKDESYFDTLLRPTILGHASFAEVPAVMSEINKRHKDTKNPTDVAPDLRGIIWNTIAREGTEDDFETFLKWHNSTDNSELRVTLSSALTGFKQNFLTLKALNISKTKDVRKQDMAYWLVYAFSNRFGKQVAWKWLKDNWQWLVDNLGTDPSFARIPMLVASVFTGQDYLKQFNEFFVPKSDPVLERAIKQGQEAIQWHTAWYDRDHAKVLEYLKSQA